MCIRDRFYIFLIVGLLLSNLVLFFSMSYGGKGQKHKMKKPKEVIIERLNLDQEQQESYSKLVEVHFSKTIELTSNVKELKQQLYFQLSQERNSKLNDSLLVEISKKHAELERLNLDHFYDLRRICKNDQLEEFDRLTKDLNVLFRKKPRRRKGKNK